VSTSCCVTTTRILYSNYNDNDDNISCYYYTVSTSWGQAVDDVTALGWRRSVDKSSVKTSVKNRSDSHVTHVTDDVTCVDRQ